VSGAYEGKQIVGMDLHRRRSVLVRMTAGGEVLERVRIVNDVDRLAAVIGRAGESPEVVLEATYGWYWAVDALREQGAVVHQQQAPPALPRAVLLPLRAPQAQPPVRPRHLPPAHLLRRPPHQVVAALPRLPHPPPARLLRRRLRRRRCRPNSR